MNSFSRRFINRLTDASQMIASNLYSGAQRVVSAVIPQSVRRRVSNFTNWLTGNVEEEQIPQVLNQVLENVEERLPRRAMPNFELVEEASAFAGLATQRAIYGFEGIGPDDFLNECRNPITHYLSTHRNIKVKLVFICEFKKRRHNVNSDEEEYEYRTAYFHSSDYENLTTILRDTDVNEEYTTMCENIMEKFVNFVRSGSGWEFNRVIKLILLAVESNPLSGSAGSFIPLPAGLVKKNNRNGLVNIKNGDDHNCFQYCCMREKYIKEKNAQRVDKKLKEQIKELNMNGIECPVKLSDIDKFENQNPDFSIVVIGYDEEDKLFPLRRQRKETFNRKYLVILLIIKNEEGNSHYVWVKDPSALLGSRIAKTHEKMYFCWNCFSHFYKEDDLRDHQEICYENDALKIVMPTKKESKIKFKNWMKTQWLNFVIFYDFESIQMPIQYAPNPENCSTINSYACAS